MRTKPKKKTKPKKRWSEMTPCQRRGIAVAATVQLGLLVGALVDLRRRPAERVNGPKSLWAAVSFVNFIGPITYFAFGRRR